MPLEEGKKCTLAAALGLVVGLVGGYAFLMMFKPLTPQITIHILIGAMVCFAPGAWLLFKQWRDQDVTLREWPVPFSIGLTVPGAIMAFAYAVGP